MSGFQGELERISGEVRTLQARSESYNLQHKRNLQKVLDNYLEQTVVTKEFADFLCTAQIDQQLDDYLEAVEKLNEMIHYVQNPP